MERIISAITDHDTTLRVYLLKKIGYKGNFEAVIFPNALNEVIRDTYAENFANFIDGKGVAEFDALHSEKGTIKQLELTALDYWPNMLRAMDVADAEGCILTPATFTDDYKMIIITYDVIVDDEVRPVYLIAQYRKVDTWYKKSVKFGVTANRFEAKQEDIFVLNGCIDAAIADEDVFILQENAFENIFNFYERSKRIVVDKKTYIETWSFINNPTEFYESVNGKKVATTKLARALEKGVTDFSALTPETVKETLCAYDEFAEIIYDEHDRIIFSSGVRDIIIDIVRYAYARGLFTNEVVYTKGV